MYVLICAGIGMALYFGTNAFPLWVKGLAILGSAAIYGAVLWVALMAVKRDDQKQNPLCAGCLMEGCIKSESSRCKMCSRFYQDNFSAKLTDKKGKTH